MISVCFYFQVHQPYRLKKNYSFFDIGQNHFYEDEVANREIMQKVAQKCYLPANKILLQLIRELNPRFRIAFSISGTAIEQFQKFCPEVLDSFKALADTGCVEFLNETYFHSLSFLYSKKEFQHQVLMHKTMVEHHFGQTPTTFRNTELIYSNELAKFIEDLGGYQTILCEGADHILGWRNQNFVYQPEPCYKLKLLLKNYRLSDDIAFRFSNPDWHGYPLKADTYAQWIHSVAGNGETVNLFLDYETFGEHQWEETGIFGFLAQFPHELLKHQEFGFRTPQEVSQENNPVSKLDVPNYVSWADVDRGITAWLGNDMQKSAIEFIYSLEQAVLNTQNDGFLHVWRKLQTSDHFYYMCTKWFDDGDVHKYFNPFKTPHDAYIAYMNVVNDLQEQLKHY